MKVALDTTYVLARGAVKDTYNLLSDGIVKLMSGLCELEGRDLEQWTAGDCCRTSTSAWTGRR